LLVAVIVVTAVGELAVFALILREGRVSGGQAGRVALTFWLLSRVWDGAGWARWLTAGLFGAAGVLTAAAGLRSPAAEGRPEVAALLAGVGAVGVALGLGLASPWVGAYQAAREGRPAAAPDPTGHTGMEVEEEEFGGTLVVLRAGGRLSAVPRSHRRLVTPAVAAWFADPPGACRAVAAETPAPRMAAWFRAAADAADWRLELHRASHGETRAGYWLAAPGVRGAEVGPPAAGPDLGRLPAALAAFYRLVGFVDWMGFGAAGGIDGPAGHTPLSAFRYEYRGAAIDPAGTFVFGWGPAGDMLVYTADGRGGWVCHENGHVHLLGTVTDTVDWVFGELLADRCPDFDYKWT
jgi:hypothetical protein